MEDTNVEYKKKSIVHEHLNVLLQNFEVYFRRDVYSNLNYLLWHVQPFTDEDFDLGYLTSELIEMWSDLVRNTEFRTFINYADFFVSLLSIPEYRHLSQKAIPVLVRMPTIYFWKQGCSALVKKESK